jgi:hypothetical protein
MEARRFEIIDTTATITIVVESEHVSLKSIRINTSLKTLPLYQNLALPVVQARPWTLFYHLVGVKC